MCNFRFRDLFSPGGSSRRQQGAVRENLFAGGAFGLQDPGVSVPGVSDSDWGRPGAVECVSGSWDVGQIRVSRRSGEELFATWPLDCYEVLPNVFVPSFLRYMLGAPFLIALAEGQGDCVYKFDKAELTFSCRRLPGLLQVRVMSTLPGTLSPEMPIYYRFPFSPFGPCGCSDMRKAFLSAELTLRAWMFPVTSPFSVRASYDLVEGLARRPGASGTDGLPRFHRIAAHFREALAAEGSNDEGYEGMLLDSMADKFRSDLKRLVAEGPAANSSVIGEAMRVAHGVLRTLTDPDKQDVLDVEEGIRQMSPITAPAA
mmetsp:Transcript_1801/g.5106  ORF Transcript_1801/g.5106 Transcript_1801/m.5106 type:complete len:315 (+) Transcript_1801:3-947(+)